MNNTTIRNYLVLYNAVAFISWAAFFVLYIAGGLQYNSTVLLLLNIAQGMAVLEVLHTVLKWVKSPVGSTLAQVASRILVLVFVNLYLPLYPTATVFKAGLVIISFAWGITEMVRYSFYLLALLGKQPAALLWMRYTFFIGLYPLGVTGEWLIILTPIVATGFDFSLYTAFAAVLFVVYAYYFPVLYGYMWKQRRQKLV